MGGFYQHYHSKRQLLLALMDELLEGLSQLHLRPQAAGDVRAGLRQLLSGAFSRDLRYLGAFRSRPGPQAGKIHAWTTARVRAVLELLQQLSGARPNVDVPGLARVLDSFFWSLLAQAAQLRKPELNRWIDSATHLMYPRHVHRPPPNT